MAGSPLTALVWPDSLFPGAAVGRAVSRRLGGVCSGLWAGGQGQEPRLEAARREGAPWLRGSRHGGVCT